MVLPHTFSHSRTEVGLSQPGEGAHTALEDNSLRLVYFDELAHDWLEQGSI